MTGITPIGEALELFSRWVTTQISNVVLPKKDFLEVWSRSPSFDEVIINNAYRRCKMKSPLPYRSSRDCRTIEAAAGLPFDAANASSVQHDALADAVAQARHVHFCLSKLGIR